jgi:hypothetical protein
LTQHTYGALELGVLAGKANKRCYVRAGRLAPDADSIGVNAQQFGIRAHVADGCLCVVQLRRKVRFQRVAIVDRGDG